MLHVAHQHAVVLLLKTLPGDPRDFLLVARSTALAKAGSADLTLSITPGFASSRLRCFIQAFAVGRLSKVSVSWYVCPSRNHPDMRPITDAVVFPLACRGCSHVQLSGLVHGDYIWSMGPNLGPKLPFWSRISVNES